MRQPHVRRNVKRAMNNFLAACDRRLLHVGKRSLDLLCCSGKNCCPIQDPLFILNGLGSAEVHHPLWTVSCSTASLCISCSPYRRDFLPLDFDSGCDRCFESPNDHSDYLDYVRISRSFGHYHYYQVFDATSR